MKSYFGLFLLVISINCTLRVYYPNCAVNQMSGNISYSLSNFGYIPYGETFIGQLQIPNDELLCGIQKEDTNTTVETNMKRIFLIKRGECKFTDKVINAQKLGADLVIVYDNKTENTQVLMKNDGHGHLAEIPSMFITKEKGEALIKTKRSCKDSLTLQVEFQVFKSDVVNVTFWLDFNHAQSYVMLREFYDSGYLGAIRNNIDLSIRMRVHPYKVGIDADLNCLGSIGLFKQIYCLNVKEFQDKSSQIAYGKQKIKEELRSYYLFDDLKTGREDTEIWWKYMIQFDNADCFSRQDVKDCSNTVMRKLGIIESMILRVNSQVNEAQAEVVSQRNSTLRQFDYQIKENGIFYFPEAVINGKNFYGLFKAPQIFEMICQSLNSPPKACYTFIKNKHRIDVGQDESIWQTVLLIVVLMTIGFLLALVIYTKIIRRQINQQLSVEVNKMVENYVNLVETNKSQNKSQNSVNAGSYQNV